MVILAGGRGSRLAAVTRDTPKPMVPIGGHPILWHIMKMYSLYGLSDFVICLGYKGNVIRDYFANFHLYNSDVTFDFANDTVEYFEGNADSWRVTLVETGLETQTGGRLKRIQSLIGEEPFCFTYGDAVTDIDIRALVDFHDSGSAAATITGVRPPGRFGVLTTEDDHVVEFLEKPRSDGNMINGGFFVLSPDVFDYIDGDDTVWEHGPMPKLAREGKLRVFKHDGFWQCMDTQRDLETLESLWGSGNPPWRLW